MELITRREFLKKSPVFLGTLLFLPEVLIGKVSGYKYGFVEKKRARYYKKLENGRVQCLLCPRKCVVSPGRRGGCRVRENIKGNYYTLVYGNPCAVHIDPIEKKPFFHFLPGTYALSVATAGCNFYCKYCQNWEISQFPPERTYNMALSPYELVNMALKYRTPSIAYTYTEPSVFYEYMLDTSKIAYKRGIKNIYHSNGYLNQKPLKALIPYLFAANIDLKGFSERFYKSIAGGRLKPVLETIKTLKKNKVWIEITNLIVPTKNDKDSMIRKMVKWIVNELGPDVPIHFSRFYPMYKLKELPPTPVRTLERAREIAIGEGMKFVYIGNVFGHEAENTYCPKCKRVLIRRKGYTIIENNIKNGRCRFCKEKIPGVW